MQASMRDADSTIVDQRGGAYSSGVSWSAVFGGAFVTAALSLIMLALGAGFGLSAVSPWSNVGVSAAAVGTAAIVWLVVTEAIASSMGGYLAGRLRIRWRVLHTNEVHFRDTANGFLVWAVALIVTVAFLATAAASMVGDTSMSTVAARQGGGLESNAYYVDRLFRSGQAPSTENDLGVRSEAAGIFDHLLVGTEVSTADTAYLAQLITAKTGLSPSDAQKRILDTIAEAKQTEDNARKATAHFLLWLFLALLIGAFCASYAATIGGRQRDHVQVL